MSDSYEEYDHLFQTFEVYPRIYYFHRRYCDLLARFTRLTGALPKCLQNDNLISQLKCLKDEFDGGIRIRVLGRDINDTDLVFDTDPKSKHTDQHRIEVVVLHICPKLLNGKEYEVTKARLKAFILDAETAGYKTFVFIKYDPILNFEEKIKFQDTVLPAFRAEFVEYFDVHSIINPSSNDTRTSISDALERYLAEGFIKIDYHVKLYESKNAGICLESSHVSANDSMARPLKAFIRNARSYVEVDILADEKEKTCSLISNHLLKSLGRVIRCSLTAPFAKKFKLDVSICNSLLCEVQFEEALLDAISENSKHHIKHMANNIYEESYHDTEYSKQTKSFDFLCYHISSNVEPVIENVEKKLHSMQRLSAIFRKMAFETRGYIKQLNIECEDTDAEQSPKMSKELLRKLLSIECVYGIGTVYGQLEIHVVKDKVMTMVQYEETDDENNEDSIDDIHLTKVRDLHKQERAGITKLKTDIDFQMREHHFTEQYTVKYVEKKPNEFVSSIDPGDRLFKENEERFGTLGGFVVTKDGTVYGLTCAHVVGPTKRIFQEKGDKELFSSCPSVVNRNNCTLRHLDIAALKIIPEKQEICKQALNSRNECKSDAIHLSFEHPEFIVGSPVFKFGAASGSTKGFVVSVDYSIFGPGSEDYLTIIDTQPDRPTDFNEKFEPINSINDQTQSQTMDQEKHSQTTRKDAGLEYTQNKGEFVSSTKNTLDEVKKLDCVTVDQPGAYVENISTNTFAENATDPSKRVKCNSRNSCDERNELRHTIVYVKNTEDEETSNEVFAKKGDSGSIVCFHQATPGKVNKKALSMLYAGDFKFGGDESLKCLSFKLNVGLQMLKQHHGLDF